MTAHRLAHEDVVGTHQGYCWHLRDGSDPCDACTVGHADYNRAWRDRRNPTVSVRVPLALLGELLEVLPDGVRGGFVRRLGHTATRATAAHRAMQRTAER